MKTRNTKTDNSETKWLPGAMKSLLLATCLGAGSLTSAHSAVIIDTLPSPLPFNGAPIQVGMTSSFTIPLNETWSIDKITLNIGQGSEANMSLAILDSSGEEEMASFITPLQLLFDFVPTEFNFTPFSLGAGTYDIVVKNYDITGIDETSFWAPEANAYKIEGSLSVPEPSSFGLLALGAGSLVLRRSRKAKAA